LPAIPAKRVFAVPLETKGSTLVSDGSPTSAIFVGKNELCLKI